MNQYEWLAGPPQARQEAIDREKRCVELKCTRLDPHTHGDQKKTS